MLCVAFPPHDARMIPASARPHAAVIEQRLTLPDDRELARRASEAIARQSRRGWRIDKPDPRSNIDAVIALAIAVERAEIKPQSVELLGWLYAKLHDRGRPAPARVAPTHVRRLGSNRTIHHS
jgi:hypothetical protein